MLFAVCTYFIELTVLFVLFVIVCYTVAFAFACTITECLCGTVCTVSRNAVSRFHRIVFIVYYLLCVLFLLSVSC